MPRVTQLPTADFRQALLETYAINERMNQLVLEQLDPRAWRAKPKGRNARTIAAIFAHMHNIRRKWIRLSAPHLKLPTELNRARCTPKQVKASLAVSARVCAQMLSQAFDPDDSRIRQFRRDGWATPWPVGPAMLTYMLMHDAHHRGQICMLAHQLGLPIKAGYKLWMWEKLWNDKAHVKK
jgi:uncharacterized damage-inducible protein DinB